MSITSFDINRKALKGKTNRQCTTILCTSIYSINRPVNDSSHKTEWEKYRTSIFKKESPKVNLINNDFSFD